MGSAVQMISVIVCTYNRCEILKLTLESFRLQQDAQDVPWEIVVVDNNSKDRTAEVVAAFAGRIPVPVRYVFEPKQGLSHARNTGINEAKGDILAFTDDDVLVDKRWIAEIAKTFALRGCSGAGGKVGVDWPCSPPSWWVSSGPYRILPGVLARYDWGDQEKECGGDVLPPFGANMIFRKSMFERYGGFKTEIGRIGKKLLSGEDTEFGYRLMANKECLIYAPNIVVSHPVDMNRLSKKYVARWYFGMGLSYPYIHPLSDSTARFLCAPRWLYRQELVLLWKWLVAIVTRQSQAEFFFKLQLCNIAGKIVGYYQSYTKPLRSENSG